MELMLIGIALILFGVSWWWDWAKDKRQMKDIANCIDLTLAFYADQYLRKINEKLERMEHDNQQIKHRLTTIKRTTKKDLKPKAKTFVHTKPKKYRK